MPLPSALDPKVKAPPPPVVECFFFGNKDGSIDILRLPRIDFDDARRSHPDDWALVEDYKLTEGPTAPKVIDKRGIPAFPTSAEMSSKPPPMGDWRPLYEFKGPSGGRLFPRPASGIRPPQKG